MYGANEAACEYVKDYIDSVDIFANDWYRSERRFDDTFAVYGYAKWAAEEILGTLKENKTAPPLEVIERFKQKVFGYAAYNKKAEIIFSIAAHVADEIVDELVAT